MEKAGDLKINPPEEEGMPEGARVVALADDGGHPYRNVYWQTKSRSAQTAADRHYEHVAVRCCAWHVMCLSRPLCAATLASGLT